MGYIQKFPDIDPPEILGLHPNADLTFRFKEVNQLLDTIVETQPKQSIGVVGGERQKTREESVYEKAEELILSIPMDYVEDEYEEKINSMGSFSIPLNIFLYQEVQRLQVCVCICVYVYVCICVYIYHLCTPLTLYTPTHLHTYTPTHLHTYTPTHLHTYHTDGNREGQEHFRGDNAGHSRGGGGDRRHHGQHQCGVRRESAQAMAALTRRYVLNPLIKPSLCLYMVYGIWYMVYGIYLHLI
jgi:hypothetical protein